MHDSHACTTVIIPCIFEDYMTVLIYVLLPGVIFLGKKKMMKSVSRSEYIHIRFNLYKEYTNDYPKKQHTHTHT